MKVLFILVDGLGIGVRDSAINPIHSGVCPHLLKWMEEEAVPLDAGLGVPGLPQSATGQTALLTGLNAPALMGRHVEGFPGPHLCEAIAAHNLYRQLQSRNVAGTFANAYFVDDVAEVSRQRHLSVTSVAALRALGSVRNTQQMLAGKAVYHDLTRAILRARGYTGPLLAPREAARHLAAIVEEQDVTLFEYFQTDRVGHAGDAQKIRLVLSELDEFLEHLAPWTGLPGHLLLLTSDHGNIEDGRTRGHTTNPVPLVAVGDRAGWVRARAKTIADVTPSILALFPGEPR